VTSDRPLSAILDEPAPTTDVSAIREDKHAYATLDLEQLVTEITGLVKERNDSGIETATLTEEIEQLDESE
jgi:hypothetical protein